MFASWAWAGSDFVFKITTMLSATSERSLSLRKGARDPAVKREGDIPTQLYKAVTGDLHQHSRCCSWPANMWQESNEWELANNFFHGRTT